jgi:hypothetical protein
VLVDWPETYPNIRVSEHICLIIIGAALKDVMMGDGGVVFAVLDVLGLPLRTYPGVQTRKRR